MIGKHSFKKCNKIRKITIDPYETKIQNNSFEECISLTEMIINTSKHEITKIEYSIIKQINTIILPKTITTISNNAFEGFSSLKKIIIP